MEPINLLAFGEWKSLREWERDPRCVVTRRTLVARFRAGWRDDDVITTPRSRGPRRAKNDDTDSRVMLLAFDEWKSVRGWSRDDRCAVSLRTLVRRFRQGWPDQKAIETPDIRSGVMRRIKEAAHGRG